MKEFPKVKYILVAPSGDLIKLTMPTGFTPKEVKAKYFSFEVFFHLMDGLSCYVEEQKAAVTNTWVWVDGNMKMWNAGRPPKDDADCTAIVEEIRRRRE